ncbi:MAG: 16S rRNA (uracil(1498)-N(3))-methyltransferase [Clostridiales bacterium]|nr:16S rRNA (uracil(1498)-N(3))-methyltransferase [Clostridiales bacterium]
MTRLFMEHEEPRDGFITLGQDDSRYISQVLRMRPGEQLEVMLKDGIEALCNVHTISKDSVTLSIVRTQQNTSEPPYRITLYQSVSKGERMELTIQKCVELGVTKIVPVYSLRCVVRPDARKDSTRTQRWQKIALEAARQSGRGIIPEVTEPVNFEQALEASGTASLVLFPWEEEKGVTLKQALAGKAQEDLSEIAVFIGPEGGYDEAEAAKARESNAIPVTIGKRILRTETAGAAVLSMLLYNFEL